MIFVWSPECICRTNENHFKPPQDRRAGWFDNMNDRTQESVQDFLVDIQNQYRTSAVGGHVQKIGGVAFQIGGIDAAGKGTGINGLKDHLINRGYRIFDVREYQQEHNRHPTPDDWKGYDVLITAEPPWEDLGRYVRHELIAKENAGKYTPRQVALGYSDSRLSQNRRVIYPALRQNKIVLEERGVKSSTVYQPTQDYFWRLTHSDSKLVLDEILAMKGNQEALSMLPDAACIPLVPAEETIRRIDGRADKKDNAIFETYSFQQVIEQIYRLPAFHDFFSMRGVQVITFDATTSKEDTVEKTIRAFESFMESRSRPIRKRK